MLEREKTNGSIKGLFLPRLSFRLVSPLGTIHLPYSTFYRISFWIPLLTKVHTHVANFYISDTFKADKIKQNLIVSKLVFPLTPLIFIFLSLFLWISPKKDYIFFYQSTRFTTTEAVSPKPLIPHVLSSFLLYNRFCNNEKHTFRLIELNIFFFWDLFNSISLFQTWNK